MFPEVEEIFRLVKSGGHQMFIVSDANTIYIETTLRKLDLLSSVDAIVTNPAHFDESGLLVIRYSSSLSYVISM
jgi:pyridoxal phosphate phosphatase PHOSPHO2